MKEMNLKKTGKRGWPQERGRKSPQIKSSFLSRIGLNFRVQSVIPRRRGARIQSKPQNSHRHSIYRSGLSFSVFVTPAKARVQTFNRKISNRIGINPIVLIFCMGFFHSGCLPPPFPTPSEIEQRSQGESQGRGRPRLSVKDKSCNENKECPDFCEIIFERRTERDDCEDRSVSEVREFKRIYYFLQGKNAEGSDVVSDDVGYFGNLNRIVAEDLEDMAGISENPATLVDDVPSGKESTFRNWLANNQDIAEILRDEDKDFTAFEEIFGNSCSAVNSALNAVGYIEKPDGNSHPPDNIAIRAGNRDFLQWIHDYLTSKDENPPDPKTLINNNEPPSDWCS